MLASDGKKKERKEGKKERTRIPIILREIDSLARKV